MDGLVSIGDSVYESKEAAERELNDYYESGADIQEEMYGINYHSYQVNDMKFECGVCGEIVEERERTSHLLNWLIPRHKEWFLGNEAQVWKGSDGKIYYNKVRYNDGKGKWKKRVVRKGKPHLSPGSTVHEYFDEIREEVREPTKEDLDREEERFSEALESDLENQEFKRMVREGDY